MPKRKKCNEKKPLFKKGQDNVNYRIRYRYTPVFNRGKKVPYKKQWVKRPTKRYTAEELKKIVKPHLSDSLAIPGADGKPGNAIILRPKIAPAKKPEPKPSTSRTYEVDTGNLLLEKSSFFMLLNESYAEHAASDKYCDSLVCDLVELKPWGAFFSAILICKNCDYKSKRTKLYEEVPHTGKRGRRAATGNMRGQLYLQDMPTFNTNAQLYLASYGIRPPSLNGMQKLSYRASKITEVVGEQDLKKQRGEVVDILKARGVEQPANMEALLSGCFDVRYSGVFKRSYCTPGPGASQATGFFCENLTNKQSVLSFDFVNQQCPKGSRLKGKGRGNVICGRGEASHPGCTATQPRDSCINERQIARRLANKLYDESKMAVTYLTCDGDASGKLGFEQANERINKKLQEEAKERNKEQSKWINKSTKNRSEAQEENFLVALPNLVRYRDPVHVTWNILYDIQSHPFSDTAFGIKDNGEKWTAKEMTECRKVLAMDMSSRVSITVRNIRFHCDGDVEWMKRIVESTGKYLLDCYNGNHRSFRRSPIAQLTGCFGENDCWIPYSDALQAQGLKEFNFNKADMAFLKKAISRKLSENNIEAVGLGSSSSRAEGVNRAYTKSLPNNVNAARTAIGRTHSVIGRVNNGLLAFSKMKFEAAGCPLAEGSEPLKAFENYQRRKEQCDEARKSQRSKARQSELMADRQKSYAQARRKISNKDEYRKFQVDEAEQTFQEASTSSQAVNKASVHLQKVKRYAEKQEKRKEKTKRRANARRSHAHKALQKAKRKVNRDLHKTPQVADHTYSRPK